MELSYERHYQTSVLLLKSDEQLIEILEDHQVNIQIIHHPPLFVSFSFFFFFLRRCLDCTAGSSSQEEEKAKSTHS